MGSTEPKSNCAKVVQVLGGYGGRDWDRTSDPCDVNAVLIPLSYAPFPFGTASIWGRSLLRQPEADPASGSKQALDLVDQVAQVERLGQDLRVFRRVVVRIERDCGEAGDEHDLQIRV